MEPWFSVDHLDVERLLSEWRWLCPRQTTHVARSAFGDLFLRDQEGVVFWLDVAVGKLTKVAESEAEFREMAKATEKRREWFAEPDVETSAKPGLSPNLSQCIGFSTPLVFAQRGSSNTPYLIDLYECVSFLGDLNRQISSSPDGTQVRPWIESPNVRTPNS